MAAATTHLCEREDLDLPNQTAPAEVSKEAAGRSVDGPREDRCPVLSGQYLLRNGCKLECALGERHDHMLSWHAKAPLLRPPESVWLKVASSAGVKLWSESKL